MPSRRLRKPSSLATKMAELALAVPQVVAHRVTRMAMAGQSPSDRDKKEFELMVAEKKVAFGESWTAMTTQAIRANQAMALSFFQSFWSPRRRKPTAGAVTAQVQRAALGVLSKGIAPVHRKAVANAKRLARTKLR
jgi:hypothetical protein